MMLISNYYDFLLERKTAREKSFSTLLLIKDIESKLSTLDFKASVYTKSEGGKKFAEISNTNGAPIFKVYDDEVEVATIGNIPMENLIKGFLSGVSMFIPIYFDNSERDNTNDYVTSYAMKKYDSIVFAARYWIPNLSKLVAVPVRNQPYSTYGNKLQRPSRMDNKRDKYQEILDVLPELNLESLRGYSLAQKIGI